jgi:alkanesulfonate monooxygenase SsuD/methylene tetrahydromethanopterin reductase-like flavin-dependent oxidoreductase (luciferase family)
MAGMDFAVNVPTSVGSTEYSMLAFADAISWDDQRAFGVEIEALGYDGLAVPDHLMTGDGAGTAECFTTLTGLAGETDDVYLYPKTVNNHLRHGPLLATIAATFDNVSDGRLKLGMGAGWKSDEALAYGYEWPSAPDRLREMEEAIEIMKRLWTEDAVTYEGDYYELEEAVCKPHPKQDPHPPIMIGGGGEEFTLRIAAKHADCWNYWGPVDLISRKLDVLAEHCETYGTDYEEIQTSWFARCAIRRDEAALDDLLEAAPRFKPEHLDAEENHLVGTPETVASELQRYVDLGIGEVVVEFIDFPRTRGAEIFAEDVIPQFR